MKPPSPLFLPPQRHRLALLAALLLAFGIGGSSPARAGTLSIEGVLANSGEQGPTLARFGDGKTRRSIGLIQDGHGSLWSSGIDREIIRYTLDGRRLATYRTPEFGPPHEGDSFTLCGDTLILKIKKKLYTLPLEAEPGSEVIPLDIEATRLAPRAHDGWAYAAAEDRVFRVNPQGITEEVGRAEGEISGLEIGPEGVPYLRIRGEMLRRQQMIRLDEPTNPLTAPGWRPHWLNGAWFGFAGHGTIRRFNRDLEPEPGVVLGGNSGSFIGYVPGNYELADPRGIAWLGGHRYAVGGVSGMVHLLIWSPREQRFEIVRRIGPLKRCDALALDSRGRVWFHGGVLHWSDGPDTPLVHGTPGAGAEGGPEPFAAANLPGDRFIAPMANEKSGGALCSGSMDGPANRFSADLIGKTYCAAAVVILSKRTALLMTDAKGAGIALFFNQGSGKPGDKAGEVVLQGSAPVGNLTSLTSDGRERLWAGAGGSLIEFRPEGDRWREVKRWAVPGADELHLSWSNERLWVSDTANHRLLVYDANTAALVAEAGTGGKPGDDLASFHSPRALSANGDRAVVFDAGNQRLLRVQWRD